MSEKKITEETFIEKMDEYITSAWNGFKRILPLLIIMLVITTVFNLWSAVAISTLIPIYAGVISHLMRKLLFPYIDLKVLIKEVKEENSIASALIVVGLIIFMTVLTAVMGFSIIR